MFLPSLTDVYSVPMTGQKLHSILIIPQMKETFLAACIQTETPTGKVNWTVKEEFPKGNSDVMMITYLGEKEKGEISEILVLLLPKLTDNPGYVEEEERHT